MMLVILLKFANVKQRLAQENKEKQDLILYNSDLEKNMKAIRNIKHDIKNLFFTMSAFVERSSDTELKQFFNERMLPYVEDEIRTNDLYTTLQQISYEPFRAFLHYKMMQALSYGVQIKLEVHIEEDNNQLYTSEMFMDLVRLLGIFMDNAIEEMMDMPTGELNIKVIQDSKGSNFIVSNPVKDRTKPIVPGLSTKGLGRGNGLKIVDEIVASYNNLILNSYYQEEQFIQNLVIYKE